MNSVAKLVLLSAASLASVSADAAIVNVNLAGATTGTTVTGVGASFAQAFQGQNVAGLLLTGAPTSPLTLKPVGSITVESFSPGVSPTSNSLLSQPDNAAPLVGLLDSLANSLTFTAGSADGGTTFLLSFYGANGALTSSQLVTTVVGYSVYSFASVPTFRGFAISANNDSAGLRFQNISYNSVAAVPEPASWALMIAGFGIAGASMRRRRTTVRLSYAKA